MPSRFENSVVSAIVRSPLHPLLGDSFAVVSLRGRRSGRPLATPVNVVREGRTVMVVSLRTRTWWRNLRDGEIAGLRLAGKDLDARGEVLESPEAVRAGLAHLFELRPGHAKYFGVRLADGKPSADALQKAAAELVVVRLHLI